MKYQNEIIIDRPIEKVIELFDNPENMAKWQPGFKSFEHINGELGKEGAVSKIVYVMGKRTIEMTETIIKRNLPHEFSATYIAGNVNNEIYNYFEKVSDHQTKWISKNIFIFKGAMRFFYSLMPKMFEKQSMKNMSRFKEFAESTDL